MILMTKEEHKF